MTPGQNSGQNSGENSGQNSAQQSAVRVLVMEDSPNQGGALTRALHDAGDMVVCARALTSENAVRLVTRETPDVIVLSLTTTDGSGQRFIEEVMAFRPTPILVLSSRIENRQSRPATDALLAGALDARPLPDRWNAEVEAQLRRSIRQLSTIQTIRHPRGRHPQTVGNTPPLPDRQPVVALAASTGGPSALAAVLAGLGGLHAPVLVVQHLHPDFIGGLVTWMCRDSALPVEIAAQGQLLSPGHVYVAPGHAHLRLAVDLRLELSSVPGTVHQPSANELFRSLAQHAGSAAIAVIMTGMGDDGARGILEVKQAGGQTFGQDEESSAVFGMPQAAERLGALTSLVPLGELAIVIKRAVALVRT